MARQEGTQSIPSIMRVTHVDDEAVTGEKKFREIFEYAKSTRHSFCPVRDIIARISDKWSMLSIYALAGYGTLRFNEIKHKIGDISQRMLTVTLRNMEADGIITRKIYPEVPPRVEYTLTPLGYELVQQIGLLADWANENGSAILKQRRKFVNG